MMSGESVHSSSRAKCIGARLQRLHLAGGDLEAAADEQPYEEKLGGGSRPARPRESQPRVCSRGEGVITGPPISDLRTGVSCLYRPSCLNSRDLRPKPSLRWSCEPRRCDPARRSAPLTADGRDLEGINGRLHDQRPGPARRRDPDAPDVVIARGHGGDGRREPGRHCGVPAVADRPSLMSRPWATTLAPFVPGLSSLWFKIRTDDARRWQRQHREVRRMEVAMPHPSGTHAGAGHFCGAPRMGVPTTRGDGPQVGRALQRALPRAARYAGPRAVLPRRPFAEVLEPMTRTSR